MGFFILDYGNFKAAAEEQRTVVLKFAQLFKVIRRFCTIFGVTNTLPEIDLTLNGQRDCD